MAGYCNYSMSNNAVGAYHDGRKPLSKITAKDVAEAGFTEPLAFAKWLAKHGHWDASEWHHTSKEYNRTDFYDADDLADWWNNDLDQAQRDKYLADYRDTKPKPTVEVRVTGTYTEFTGSRNHPKPVQIAFTGTLRGDWIHLDNGKRKRATGNWITFTTIK